MATVLITGGTGTIGKALTKALLHKQYEVIILTRQPEKYTTQVPGVTYAKWDVAAQSIDVAAIAKADHIVHLAGASVTEGRWSKKRKQEIIDSRVKSSELIVNTLQQNQNKVQSVISASATGWYGEDPSIPSKDPFREEAPAANDFLGNTCQQWEQSTEPLAAIGKRLVKLRTGIVLSNDGGAFVEFKKPLRFGIAAILSTGKQIISWIHVDDLVRLYITAIENENFHGVYNAVAPKPISNKELVLEIAHIEKGKFFIPLHVPSFVLKLVLGEMSVEVLKSATVSCNKVHVEGFTFLFPSVEAAVKDLLTVKKI